MKLYKNHIEPNKDHQKTCKKPDFDLIDPSSILALPRSGKKWNSKDMGHSKNSGTEEFRPTFPKVIGADFRREFEQISGGNLIIRRS